MKTQMAASTMESSRSTATTGATITEVTPKTFATRTVKVWPGPQGGRGERDDQALLTGLLFPLQAWECPQRDGPRSSPAESISPSFSCDGNYFHAHVTDEQTESHRTSPECQAGGPEGSALTIKD